MSNIEHSGIPYAAPDTLSGSWADISAACDPHVLPIAAAGISALKTGLRQANNLRATGLAAFGPLLHGLPNPGLVEALIPGTHDKHSGARLALDGLTIIATALQVSRIFNAQPVTNRDPSGDSPQDRGHFMIREAELPISPELQGTVGDSSAALGPRAIIARISTNTSPKNAWTVHTTLHVVTKLSGIYITDTLRVVDYPQSGTTNIYLSRAATDGVVAEPQDARFRLLDAQNSVIAQLTRGVQSPISKTA